MMRGMRKRVWKRAQISGRNPFPIAILQSMLAFQRVRRRIQQNNGRVRRYTGTKSGDTGGSRPRTRRSKTGSGSRSSRRQERWGPSAAIPPAEWYSGKLRSGTRIRCAVHRPLKGTHDMQQPHMADIRGFGEPGGA